jgi:hypothetical protein
MGTLSIPVTFSAGTVVHAEREAVDEGINDVLERIQDFHNKALGVKIEGSNFQPKSIPTGKIDTNAIVAGDFVAETIPERAIKSDAVTHAEIVTGDTVQEKHIDWAGGLAGRLLRVQGFQGTYALGRANIAVNMVDGVHTATSTLLWAGFEDGDPGFFNLPAQAAYLTFVGSLESTTSTSTWKPGFVVKYNSALGGIDWRVTRADATGAFSANLNIFALGRKA